MSELSLTDDLLAENARLAQELADARVSNEALLEQVEILSGRVNRIIVSAGAAVASRIKQTEELTTVLRIWIKDGLPADREWTQRRLQELLEKL